MDIRYISICLVFLLITYGLPYTREQKRLSFALSAASHLQVSRTEVFFWRSYSGFAITHGLRITKMVETERIELSISGCKPEVIPFNYIPEIISKNGAREETRTLKPFGTSS